MSFLTELLKKEWARYVLTLVAGVAIGAITYPTKDIEERLTKKYSQEISVLKETHSKELIQVKETMDATISNYNKTIAESEKKVTLLTSENKTLRSKKKTSYYKIIKPDGTIEIKKFSESEDSESSQVITQIQEEQKQKLIAIEIKYEEIHKKRIEEIKKDFDTKESSYKKTIEELESSKTISINKKKFGAEVGANTEKQYYVHGTGTLFGPVFVGIHGEANKEMDKKSIGLGVGINF